METALYFFQSWEGNFWRWADNGTVAETSDGKTIVYRDDLIRILEELMPDHLPPLDAIMLVLMACRLELKCTRSEVRVMLAELLETDIQEVPDEVGLLLENIRKLPPKYRTGSGKVLLLKALGPEDRKVSPVGFGPQVLELFKTGRLSGLLIGNSYHERVVAGIDFLANAFSAYPQYDALLRRLETGHKEVPGYLPIEFPDILSELDADGKTAGISRLARLLKAVMRFPPDTEEGVNDPFGGVSDIGNRGDLHRLLLSELAQDDDMLLARLANNETLFYRKEDTPSPPDLEKFVCIDVTIRMWGANRLFAIAAALAYTLHDDAEVWMMTGDEKLPADLYTGTGVIEAMTHLSGGQDCGSAMLAADKALKGGECLFVSSEENFHSADFQAAWVKMKNPPSMLALIGQEGVINVYRTIRHHRKLLSTATYDLQDVLTKRADVVQHTVNDTELPAIFRQREWPLYFPLINRGATDHTDCIIEAVGSFRVTFDGRLMMTVSNSLAGVELLQNVRPGVYCYGYRETDKLLSLLVREKDNVYCRYVVDLTSNSLLSVEPFMQPAQGAMVFNNHRFYVIGSNAVSISAFDRLEVKVESLEDVRTRSDNKKIRPGAIKMRVNYSVYTNPDMLYLTKSGSLEIGKAVVSKLSQQEGFLLQPQLEEVYKHAQKDDHKIYFSANRGVWLKKQTWAGGHTSWMDSRGFLHLRSADPSIPEITIMTITGRTSAAWTSDGCICGFEGFLNRKTDNRVITVEEFWEKYWQPLIKSLH